MLLSDVYTDTVRRKKMVDKRARKMSTVLEHLPAPKLEGPAEAEVTLVGWGSTWGVLVEAAERLNREGISANHLQVKFLVPFHAKEVTAILGKSRRIIVVENNHSGQFARHLRAETGIAANGHVRKYDGEPFEPRHVVAAVKEILATARRWSRCSRPSRAGRRSTPPARAATGRARTVAVALRAAVGALSRRSI